VRLDRIEVRNFRCFSDFTLDIAGESLLLVAPNAGGKTALLTAVRLALNGGTVSRGDFRDLGAPVELIATVSDIPPTAHGVFADAMDFGTTPPTLRIAVRGAWDPVELEVESHYGFPDDGWRRAGREARENLPVLWLPAWRDAGKLTPFVGRQSILEELVRGLTLDDHVDQAVTAMTTASDHLARAEPLQQLVSELRDELAAVLPRVDPGAYSLGLDVAEPHDVLRQFELLLAHRGPEVPVVGHSDGLRQASIFALTLRLLTVKPGALLLVDEPEISLHPHGQRALVAALRGRARQSILATHTATALDRVDPRTVTRLRRDAGGDTESVRASGMTDVDARRLSRYATSQTAEAYFAETVILVEGFSDLLAVRAVSPGLGVNLDGAGVSLLSLDGGDLFMHYLHLLGPEGLDLDLRGLCDADKEASWTAKLNGAGVCVVDRASLNAAGVQVCAPDLEGELLAALSDAEINQALNCDGALGDFQTWAAQQPQATLTVGGQHERFVKRDKIRWAPLLAAAIDPANVPTPLINLLANL